MTDSQPDHDTEAEQELESRRDAEALEGVRVTRYEVNLLPEAYAEAYHWAITVEYRGKGQWAVLHFGFCLGTDGAWDYEPRPSNREDEWIASHRFDLETALRLARKAAPTVSVNNLTPADIFARHPELTEASRD